MSRLLAITVLGAAVSACVDEATAPDLRLEVGAVMSVDAAAPPPPAGLVTVGSMDIWPWTGRDLSGDIADPMNLIFTGDVDVVSLRAALLSLDGNRTAYGFPNSFPFNCTWSDAHGEVQTTFTSEDGWVGSAIQLQCGTYSPLRFHVRLFNAGSSVVGAVHMDLLIPGTPQHQTINWEVPQQLVTVDFARSGLLTAAPGVQAVNSPGAVQAIPKPIYDGMPDALKVGIGLPPGPAPGPSVPVPSDGLATVLSIGTAFPITADLTEYDLSLTFNQVIPRPFCAQGPADYVRIQGPVHITVRTRVTEQGMVEGHNTLRGDLDITPIDITTFQPSGPTFRAQISQIDNAGVGPNGTQVNAVQVRKALPPGVGFLKTHLVTGVNGMARFTESEKCN